LNTEIYDDYTALIRFMFDYMFILVGELGWDLYIGAVRMWLLDFKYELL